MRQIGRRQMSKALSTSPIPPRLTPEQREQLLRLGDDLEQLWDHPNSSVTLKKRILRTVLEEAVADTTDDPPSVHLKLHWVGRAHTELTVRKNRTGYHNHINSEEVTALIRQLALVCEDGAIVSILNRLGYRTGTGNTWTEKRVQHVRHTKGFPACPPPDQLRWITMRQAASMLGVSETVVRRLIAQKNASRKANRQIRSVDDRADPSRSPCCSQGYSPRSYRSTRSSASAERCADSHVF
jgi:hypothetical protein